MVRYTSNECWCATITFSFDEIVTIGCQIDRGNVVLLAYHIALGVPVCRQVVHKVKRYLLRFPEKHCVVRLRQQNATDY